MRFRVRVTLRVQGGVTVRVAVRITVRVTITVTVRVTVRLPPCERTRCMLSDELWWAQPMPPTNSSILILIQ